MADSNKEKKSKTSRQDVVILIVGLIVLLGAIAFIGIFMPKKSPKATEKVVEQVDLSALHVFPPIDFVDSLYYKKVLVSYNDDEESPRDVFYYKMDDKGQPTDEKVHETHYYPGNKKYIDGNVANDSRDGLWYAYHPNGNVQTMAHYRNGVEDGQYTVYYENGSVRYTGKYKAGKRIGVWSFFDENEKLVKTQNFDQK
ncbi:MAG: hypothetical protein MJZ57_03095 [Bacteroidales bacterium]|nr:hypothetical protein [Bacteroidales bacterium]